MTDAELDELESRLKALSFSYQQDEDGWIHDHLFMLLAEVRRFHKAMALIKKDFPRCVGCGQDALYMCTICRQPFCQVNGCEWLRIYGGSTHEPTVPLVKLAQQAPP